MHFTADYFAGCLCNLTQVCIFSISRVLFRAKAKGAQAAKVIASLRFLFAALRETMLL